MVLITPKYLTEKMAEQAIEEALLLVTTTTSSLWALLRKRDCHIVVIVPAMKDDRAADYPDWPDYPLEPFVLCERSVGKHDDWEHPFDEIARCKALQLWTDRHDGRAGVLPHFLFPGDTPYWGGVKREGIVVACSGFKQHFDLMVAGIVADILLALAYDAYEKDKPRLGDADFLD